MYKNTLERKFLHERKHTKMWFAHYFLDNTSTLNKQLSNTSTIMNKNEDAVSIWTKLGTVKFEP